jgi:hypothetical protein
MEDKNSFLFVFKSEHNFFLFLITNTCNGFVIKNKEEKTFT